MNGIIGDFSKKQARRVSRPWWYPAVLPTSSKKETMFLRQRHGRSFQLVLHLQKLVQCSRVKPSSYWGQTTNPYLVREYSEEPLRWQQHASVEQWSKAHHLTPTFQPACHQSRLIERRVVWPSDEVSVLRIESTTQYERCEFHLWLIRSKHQWTDSKTIASVPPVAKVHNLLWSSL